MVEHYLDTVGRARIATRSVAGGGHWLAVLRMFGTHRIVAALPCAVSSVVEHYLDTVGVTGSNPVSRSCSCSMFYTYVLRCADGYLYVGSATDLRKRVADHQARRVPATAHRLPAVLEYYEACRSEIKARLREKQLKTGFGRAYLKRRLG